MVEIDVDGDGRMAKRSRSDGGASRHARLRPLMAHVEALAAQYADMGDDPNQELRVEDGMLLDPDFDLAMGLRATALHAVLGPTSWPGFLGLLRRLACTVHWRHEGRDLTSELFAVTTLGSRQDLAASLSTPHGFDAIGRGMIARGECPPDASVRMMRCTVSVDGMTNVQPGRLCRLVAGLASDTRGSSRDLDAEAMRILRGTGPSTYASWTDVPDDVADAIPVMPVVLGVRTTGLGSALPPTGAGRDDGGDAEDASVDDPDPPGSWSAPQPFSQGLILAQRNAITGQAYGYLAASRRTVPEMGFPRLLGCVDDAGMLLAVDVGDGRLRMLDPIDPRAYSDYGREQGAMLVTHGLAEGEPVWFPDRESLKAAVAADVSPRRT